MIPDALIVPSECAPTSLEVKRALLSYNKVLIVSPGDRDVIPSRTFGLALGLPPIMSWEMGPVMPMGKAPGYDNEIDVELFVLDDMLINDTTENKDGISTSPIPSETVLYFQQSLL